MSEVSLRAQAIRPFVVMDVVVRAKALEASGRDIVRMEMYSADVITNGPNTAKTKSAAIGRYGRNRGGIIVLPASMEPLDVRSKPSDTCPGGRVRTRTLRSVTSETEPHWRHPIREPRCGSQLPPRVQSTQAPLARLVQHPAG